jgi:hypothetical protein
MPCLRAVDWQAPSPCTRGEGGGRLCVCPLLRRLRGAVGGLSPWGGQRRAPPVPNRRRQYNLPNPRRGIMMRLTQSYHTRALPADCSLWGRLRRKRRRSFRRPASKDWSSSRGSDTIELGSFTAEVGRRCHHQDRRRQGVEICLSASSPLEWGDRNEMQSRSALPLQPSDVRGLEVLANRVLGCRFKSKSIAKKIKPIARRHLIS